MNYEESDSATARRVPFRSAPSINVTPLIDVLLVLLIIFMVIQPRREARFESQTPQKPEMGGNVAPPSDLLMVEVKTGTGLEQMVELNSTPIALIDLGIVLREVLEQRPSKTVFIKAPKEKFYGDIVAVIDVLKGAGAKPIGLQIDFL